MSDCDETRQTGIYWVKTKDEDKWQIAMFYRSWGIYGWWFIGDNTAVYDDHIVAMEGPLLPPDGSKMDRGW